MRRERETLESKAQLELRVDAEAARAGLRVLRDLGDGGTSRVCLAVPIDADPFGPLDAPRTALKVARFSGKDARPTREDRVLAAVRSPHVVALLRTLGPGSTTLLLEYVAGGTLAELLARREFVRLGEAVTIVVSVLRALRAIHGEGYAHGSLSASKVMFAADGRPIIVGLSHASSLETKAGASIIQTPDTDGFREIVRLVARAVGDPVIVPEAEELAALAKSALPQAADSAGWEQLEADVFAIGRPEPVLLVPPGGPVVHGADSTADDTRQRAEGRRESVGAFRTWHDRVDGAAIRRRLREKRRLVIYSAGCIALAATTVAVVVGAPQSNEQSRSAPAPVSGTWTPLSAGETPGTESQPTAPAHPLPTPGDTGHGTTDPGPDEDPVDAADRLLRARLACFSATPLNGDCLDALLQPGSAMDAIDRAELRVAVSAGAASERDYRDYEVSLLERMGDAALVALTPSTSSDSARKSTQTKPASLLIVRGEAGWRLRELFEN
ncbi:protein kinase domain-containing protein [Diaminobutyricibacter sp. McL0608]|uniref:protein kinase domain-containing protein n=1 Tax=Leifsonia sp. McL0608 TaxID=3143537 RepID=UPI0031F319AB